MLTEDTAPEVIEHSLPLLCMALSTRAQDLLNVTDPRYADGTMPAFRVSS